MKNIVTIVGFVEKFLQPMKHLTTTRTVISAVSNVKFAFTMNSNLTNTRSVIIFEHFLLLSLYCFCILVNCEL